MLLDLAGLCGERVENLGRFNEYLRVRRDRNGFNTTEARRLENEEEVEDERESKNEEKRSKNSIKGEIERISGRKELRTFSSVRRLPRIQLQSTETQQRECLLTYWLLDTLSDPVPYLSFQLFFSCHAFSLLSTAMRRDSIFLVWRCFLSMCISATSTLPPIDDEGQWPD